jgi:putative chitinase
MITSKDLLFIAGTKKGNEVTDQIAAAVNKYAAIYGCTTRDRLAEFLGNVSHETGGFTRLSENLNYSVSGLLTGFGRHRISKVDAQDLGRTAHRDANQVGIANTIYGGEFGRKDLGNKKPGDGWKYRGAGPGQITGLGNFEMVQKETGLPVVENPDLLRDPDIGTMAALMLWQKWGLNEMADRGSTTAIRQRWNGGKKGLNEVTAAVARAKSLNLRVPAAAKAAPKVTPQGTPKVEAPAVPAIPTPIEAAREVAKEVAKQIPKEIPKEIQKAIPSSTAIKLAVIFAGIAATSSAWWHQFTAWFGGLFQ